MKKLLIGVAIVIVLLLMAILVVPSFVDWNDYRKEIAAQIESATGRTVRIDGEVTFAVLPSPALSVEGLRISNLPGAATVDFAIVRSLDVEVALLPLLTGTIEVKRVVLIEPVIELEILPDGRRNWVFVEDGAVDQSGGGPDVVVNRFLLENGTIVYRDGTDEPQRLEGLTVEVTADSLDGPFDLSGNVRLNDQALTLTARVGSLAATRIPVEADIVAAENDAKITFSGVGSLGDSGNSLAGQVDIDVAQLGRLFGDPGDPGGLLAQKLKVRGRAAMDASRISLDDLEIDLGSIKAAGAVSYRLEPDPSFKVILAISPVDLDKYFEVNGTAEGGTDSASEKEPFTLPENLAGDIEITAPGVTLRGETIRQVRLTALVADGQINLTSATALLPGGSDFALSGATTGSDAAGAFAGRLRLGSANPRALVAWLGGDVSDMPVDRLTQLSLQAGLSLTESQVQLHDLDLQFDLTKVTGGVAYALRDRSSFSATLTLDRLNLDAYMPEASDETVDWQESLTVLADFDANLNLAVDRLTVQGTQLAGVTVNAALLAGRLSLEPLKILDIGGGNASLSGTASGFGETLKWDLKSGVSSKATGALANLLGIELPSESFSQAPVTLRLQTKGTMASASLAANGGVGGTTFTLTGDGRQWDQTDGTVTLRVDLNNPSWAAFARQLDLDTFAPLEGHDAPVSIKGTVEGVGDDYNLNLAVDVSGGRLSVAGPVKDVDKQPSFDLQFGLSSDKSRTFLRGIGIDFDPAKRELGATKIAGRIEGTLESYAVEDLDVRVGPASLVAALSYDETGGRPVMDIDIKAEKLNLDLFLPTPETGAQVVKQDKGDRWSNDLLDWSALREIDAQISFSADEFSVRRYPFDAVEMEASLADGQLKIAKLAGFLFGGEVNATGSIDGRNIPALSLTLDVKQGSVEQFLAALADQQTATGTFDVSGQMTAKGTTELKMISGLKGKLGFVARDGIVRGFDTERLSQEVANLLAGAGAIEAISDARRIYDAYLEEGETPYTRVQADFSITEGKAVTRGAIAELAASEGTANAWFDLPKWTMDADLVFRLVGEAHSQTPPVGKRVWGPIDNPQEETRIAALTQFVGKKLTNRVLKDVFSTDGEGDTALRRLLGGGQSGQQAPQQQPEPNAQPLQSPLQTPPQQQQGPPQQQDPQPQSRRQPENPIESIFLGIMNQVREDRQDRRNGGPYQR